MELVVMGEKAVKMKSVVIKQPDQLVIEERDILQPVTNEVRVKVLYASICGSDIHIWHGHNPFVHYPRVIGHEFVGVIDAIGYGVDYIRLGERVVVDPVVSCGHCYPCSVSKSNVCTSLQVIGVHRDGGFSQYAYVPAENAYVVPTVIPDKLASLVEPFTIAANITAYLKPRKEDIALIYGSGPMGLAAIQVLKGIYTVSQIIAVDRVEERLSMARANGADITLNNNIEPAIEQLVGDSRPTLIIDAACHPAILTEAAALASPAARIGLLGFSTEPSSLTQKILTSKEISIFTSRLNSKRFPLVMKWMVSGSIAPEKLITHDFPLIQVSEAMRLFESDPQHCYKVILNMEEF